jgi:hypothetical protein
MSKLDQIVYLIDNGKIIESTIRALDGYIDETTTPHGIAPRFHVRGTELWTWGHAGNFPRMVSSHDTEAEAIEALEDSFAYDFWQSNDFDAFTTREDAEASIKDNT